MKLLLLISSLLLSALSFGQNRAVKDNVACLYGVKSDSGEWILEPSYQLIEGYSNGYFMMHDGVSYGLLNVDGQEVIPCEFERIRQLGTTMQKVGAGTPISRAIEYPDYPVLLEAIKGRERGLYKLNGELIAPLGAQSFKRDEKNLIISEYDGSVFVSRYQDMQGNVLIDNIQGVLMPFRKRDYSLVGGTYGHGGSTMRIGVSVIDKTGKRLLPQSFNEARICSNNTIVYMNSSGKIGVIQTNGEELIQPNYAIHDARLYTNELPCLGRSDRVFIITDSLFRMGLMNGKGEVLCRPGYERIDNGYGWMNTDDVAYRTYIGNKKGLLSKDGRVVIPCVYDTLLAFAYNTRGGQRQGGFIAKKNNRYGVIDCHGKELIPCEYSYFERTPQEYDLIFGRQGAMFVVSTASDSLKVQPIDVFYNEDNLMLFESRPGKIVGLSADEEGTLRPVNVTANRNVLIISELGKRTVLTKSGKSLNLGDISRVITHAQILQVILRDGKEYLIDTEKAEVIREPEAYASYSLNYASINYIWAKKQGEVGDWVILDLLGNESAKHEFDAPFRLSDVQTYAKAKGNWGLYDPINMKWLIEPNYRCLSKLKDGYYKAQQTNLSWDLVRLGHPLLVMGAEKMTVLLNEYGNDQTAESVLLEVAFKGQSSYLIDAEGNTTTSASEIQKRKKYIAFGYPLNANSENFRFAFNNTGMLWSDYQAVSGMGNLISTELLDTPLAGLLYDSLQMHFDQSNKTSGVILSNNGDYCQCKINIGQGLSYDLIYFNEYAASVTTSRFSQGYDWDMGSYQLESILNVVYKNGEMQPISLIEIYEGQQDLLYEDFIATLNDSETLVLECSTVENMLERIQNRFLFTEAGLQLTLSQNSGRNVQITIPWERLMEHEETKTFAAKFLKKNEENPD